MQDNLIMFEKIAKQFEKQKKETEELIKKEIITSPQVHRSEHTHQ